MTDFKEERKGWKPRRPRFIVEECDKCSNDIVFKNGKVVYNQNLGMAYSVDEIVEVLNNDYFSDYLFELLQVKIWYCQAKKKEASKNRNASKIDYYHNLEFELKELRDECHNYSSIFKYTDFLKEYIKENKKGENEDV